MDRDTRVFSRLPLTSPSEMFVAGDFEPDQEFDSDQQFESDREFESEQESESSMTDSEAGPVTTQPRTIRWAVLEEAFVPVATLSVVVEHMVRTPEMLEIALKGPKVEHSNRTTIADQALCLLKYTPRLILEAEVHITFAHGQKLKHYLKHRRDTGCTSAHGHIAQRYNDAVEWAKRTANKPEIKVLNYSTPPSWDRTFGVGEAESAESVDSLREAMGLDFVGAVATFILRFDFLIDGCAEAPVPAIEKSSLFRRLLGSKRTDKERHLWSKKTDEQRLLGSQKTDQEIDLGRPLELGAVSEWAKYWREYFASVKGAKALEAVCDGYSKDGEAAYGPSPYYPL